MRTFIALNLPETERQRIDVALERLRDRGAFLRWVGPEAFHITLKFLGDIEGGEQDAIEHALRERVAGCPPLHLRLGGLGAFPSLRRASVIWVGVERNTSLERLQQDVELACARLGYQREQRPWRPHVTVARLQSGARPVDMERDAGLVEYNGECAVDSVELMHSRLGPAGARYTVLRRWPLGRLDTPDPSSA